MGTKLFDAEFLALQKLLEWPEVIGGLRAGKMRKKWKNRHFLTGARGVAPPRGPFYPHISFDITGGQTDGVRIIWIDLRKKIFENEFF